MHSTPAVPAARHMLGERGIARRQDDAAGLGLHAGSHGGCDRGRQHRAAERRESQAGPVDRSERVGEATGDQATEPLHRVGVVVGAQHLVGEHEQQLAPGGVGEQPPEAVCAPGLASRRLRRCATQQRLRE